MKQLTMGTIVDITPENVYTVEFVDENGDTNEEALMKYFKEEELIKA